MEARPGQTILAIVPDLLVASRIEEAARRIGVVVETAGSAEEAMARLNDARVDLLVVDLATPRMDVEAVAEAARRREVIVVAFYPHVEAELRRAARRAGIEGVYARSRFLRDTVKILGEELEGRG